MTYTCHTGGKRAGGPKNGSISSLGRCLIDFSVLRAAACGQMTVQCVCVRGGGEDRADLTVLFLKSPSLFT